MQKRIRACIQKTSNGVPFAFSIFSSFEALTATTRQPCRDESAQDLL